jgi:glycosyltransferase involved in cell wall biosynthesis
MIRVLHVSTPSTWRGGEQQVFNLSLMQSQGSDVLPMVLTPKSSELGIRLREQKVHVIEFDSAGVFKISLARTISQLCKAEKIDLVHTHDSHAHTAAVLSASLFGNATPLVVHRRVDFPVSGSPFSKWKYNHASVRKIICVSDMIRTVTQPAINASEKLEVIYSGVDPQRYAENSVENILRKEFGVGPEYLLIGNLSALADHKDYPTFLRTIPELGKRGLKAKYIIAGDGPDREKIVKLAQEMHVEDQIIFTGFRKDVVQVMLSLDVFLMTSKTEGLGTILIEAFLAGVPVVATRAGGIPELVKHGDTGLLCPVADVQCLADAVQRLVEDPKLRSDLSNRARTFAQQFSQEHTAARTLELYREVLQVNESQHTA